MSEEEYRSFVGLQRIAAHQHLNRLLTDWRRELWPKPYSDPIAREKRRERLRRELAADAYWGTGRGRMVYGGVCVG